MVNILFRKFNTARKIGMLRSARISFGRLFLTALAKVCKFDPWHAKPLTSAMPFRKTVAILVNKEMGSKSFLN